MSKYLQGIFIPNNKYKYKGDLNNIVYRSGLELSYFTWCDNNPSIIEWSSEEYIIPYENIVDGKIHRYFVDLWMKIKDKNGNIQEYIAEIKPKAFTNSKHLYTASGKLTKSTRLKMEWIKNQMKWKQAKKYADKKGIKFIILTEDDIYGRR